MGNNFEGNKKIFRNEIKRMKKGEQARDEMVKYMNGQTLRDGVEVRRRWAKYFGQVLTVADVGRFEWKSNIASGGQGGCE